MKIAQAELIAALRVRYDHYTAQTMFEVATTRAGLADKPMYEPAEIVAFRAALVSTGERLGILEARLASLLGEQDTTPATPASAVTMASEPIATEPSPAEPAPPPVAKETPAAPEPVDAKTDAKADAKTDAKTDAKHEAKTDAKTDAKTASIETTIALSGVDDVDDGEEVLVCGGLAELGDWDPTRATTMARKGKHWLLTIEHSPDADVAFKFLRRDAKGKIVWEGGDNRQLVAKPRIEATWRDR